MGNEVVIWRTSKRGKSPERTDNESSAGNWNGCSHYCVDHVLNLFLFEAGAKNNYYASLHNIKPGRSIRYFWDNLYDTWITKDTADISWNIGIFRTKRNDYRNNIDVESFASTKG
jgi:hypothetical protein